MKRIVSLILVGVMLLSVTPTMALASASEQTITPLWINTNMITMDLYFNPDTGSGYTGEIVISILGQGGVSNIKATVTLYYKNIKGVWIGLDKVWNYDVNQPYLDIYEVFRSFPGKEFKVDLVLQVTKNGVTETITDYITGYCPTEY